MAASSPDNQRPPAVPDEDSGQFLSYIFLSPQIVRGASSFAMGLGILESFACILVALLALCRKPVRWLAGLSVIATLLAWWLGSAKGLLAPLLLVGMVYLVPKRLRFLSRWFSLTAVAATLGLCWLFPVPEEPKLSGRHGVGTMTIELPGKEDSPRLVIQLWYPSDVANFQPAVKWLPDASLVPQFPFHRLAFANAMARLDASPAFAAKPLRVLFYEHGWMGHRAENIVQIEDLASCGYVVVAIDHPGQASRVTCADGTVTLGNLPGDPPMGTAQDIDDFETLAERCLTTRLAEVERVRLALAGDAAGLLKGNIDVEHAGVFGFSFGGSTALRLCDSNPHFIAGANEDGFYFDSGLPQVPMLFFDDEPPSWLLNPPAGVEPPGMVFQRASEMKVQQAVQISGNHRVVLVGANHQSFTDRIYACRLPRLARAGKRSAEEVHRNVVTNLNNFFREALK